MAINRRHFLGLPLLSLSPSLWGQNNTATRPGLLSCRTDHQGRHFFSHLNAQNHLVFDIRLPARGHAVALSADKTIAAVFARRPGDFVWLVDLASGQVIQRIAAAEDRHFYGHGVFSSDKQMLFCSENDFDAGEGVIGLYDLADNGRRIGEISSHGIGPHEMRWLSDKQTLVVANGGIRTHPDLPRIKQNLSSMQPNLAYVDSRNGQLLQQHEPPSKWHQLSIRHIDIANDDSVAIAMQFEGKPTQHPPLIALQKGDSSLRLLTPPDLIQRRMRNYCGSVAFSKDGSRFAVSSPRGGLATVWTRKGDYLGSHSQTDACGLAKTSDQKGFLISDGRGRIQQLDASSDITMSVEIANTHWDNHMLAL